MTFSYDINGILLVLMEVPSKSKKYEMVIAGRDDMSEAEKQRRIQELSQLKVAVEEDENHQRYMKQLQQRILRMKAAIMRKWQSPIT